MDEHSIFIAALECDSEQTRHELLREACAGNETLHERVLRLLKLHESAGDFLEESVMPGAAAAAAGELPGSKIGPYKLLEQVGEGGMGIVFAAQQNEPVKRTVAIKIIKPGMDTKQVLARFESERQALAMMEHPNIARVLDAGATDSGRPYFVMELVRGVPITEYCDRERLTTEARLALFITICDAVQHAHQKGIIHRDIKPSNILVTPSDGRHVVKMIDFGVAKLTHGRLTERTLFTNLGQIIGTPMYMSPEQAELTGMDVDTRSDIYSLGVLLYELLTGTTPLQRERFAEVGYDELRRLIREEDAPRPSTRVSTIEAEPASIFASRNTDQRRLRRLLSGDLDWISLKSIDKARSRRYQTAAELSDDIKRFLANEPVEACPPSLRYQLKKAIARHRAAVLSIGLILALLIASAGISTWLTVRAVRAERLATEAQHNAETKAAIAIAINDFLTNDLLRQASPYEEPDRDVKLRDIVDRASQRIDGTFKGQPLVEAAIRMNLGITYLHVGDYDAAGRHFDRAADLRSQQLGANATETLQAAFYQARTVLQLGGRDQAASQLERVYQQQLATLGPEHHDTLLSMDWLGYSYVLERRYEDAEPLLTSAAAAFERVLGAEHPDTLDCLEALTIMYRYQKKFDLAEPLTQRVLQSRQRILGESHPQTLDSLISIAALYNAMGQPDRSLEFYEQARQHYVEVFGEEHPFTLSVISSMATLLADQKRYEDAEDLYFAVLGGQTQAFGRDDERTLLTMRRLASVLESQGRFSNAEKIYLEALDSRRRVFGNSHEFTLSAVKRLAACYRQQNRLDEAVALYQEVFQIHSQLDEKANLHTVNAMSELAAELQRHARYAESEAIFRQVLVRREQILGSQHPDTIASRMSLAFLAKLQRHFEEAEQLFRQVLDESKIVLGPEHVETLRAANQLSVVWRHLERYSEAEVLCRATLEARQRVLGNDNLDTFYSLNDLALIYSCQRRHDEAVLLCEQTLAAAEKLFNDNHWLTRDTASHLERMRRDQAAAVSGKAPVVAADTSP